VHNILKELTTAYEMTEETSNMNYINLSGFLYNFYIQGEAKMPHHVRYYYSVNGVTHVMNLAPETSNRYSHKFLRSKTVASSCNFPVPQTF